MRNGRFTTRLTTFFSAIGLLLIAGVASAGTYKLYINKEQNSANVILFEDTLTASVKHTVDGMELTIPGVEVSLRCKSTDANSSSDSCLIAIEPGAATTTSTGSTSTTTTDTSAPASTSGSSTDSAGDCVVTSWNPCTSSTNSSGSTTSTGSTGSTDSSGSTTSTDTTTSSGTAGGSGTCGGGVECGSLDFGSAGAYASGSTNVINVNPGTTLAMPFTTSSGRFGGQVSVVPTSSELPQDGSVLRMWISATAGGSLLGPGCAIYPSYEGSINWDQTGERKYDCQVLPSNKYFLNYRTCIAASTDLNCSSPSAKNGGQTARLFTTGRLYNR